MSILQGKEVRHMTKIGKKLAAVLLAVAMVVTFMPVLGTQTVYALGVTLPASGNCGQVQDDEFSDNAVFTYDSDTGALVISGTGEIGSRAFADYSDKASIRSVVINAGITDISPNAFEGLTNITSVSFPNGLVAIGAFAFYNCFDLNTVTFPDTLETIDTQAFYNDGISVIDIPASMKELNWDAFGAESGYGNITKVIMRSTDILFTERIVKKLPNTIQTAGPIGGNYDYQFAWTDKIPDQAFAYLKNNDASYLASVVLPDSITEIGYSAFSGATNLESINFPEGLKTIGWYAFYGTGLTNVSLPDSVTEIGREAFNECQSLGRVSILNPGCEIYDIYADGSAISADAAISGYNTSTAQSFAEKYGRIFESLGDVPTEIIKTVDIGNIWTNLDPVNVIPFTAEVHDELDSDGVNFNDKMEVSDEAWISDNVINKNDGSGIPKVGKSYEYSIVLKAKPGWAFSDDFTFIYGGKEIAAYDKEISDDGKGLVLSKFMDPITVEAVNISAATVTGVSNKTYSGKAQTQNPAVKMNVNGTAFILKDGTDYTVSYKNNLNAGTATVTITGKGSYTGTISKTFKINKATNPLKISPKTATVKYSKLKKKAQTLAATKVIKFTKKLNDKKTYSLVSAKKGSKSFKKYFKINKTTGKVTIKKNKKMKKGTYKVKVKVKALGNANYNASAVKTVTFKVKVK